MLSNLPKPKPAHLTSLHEELSEADAERFWSRVNRDGSCWPISTYWEAARGDFETYPLFWACGRGWRAQLVSVALSGTPLVKAQAPMMTCGNFECVRPEHILFVPSPTTVMAGETIPAKNARKTHCVHGHPFDRLNTYHYESKGKPRRGCLQCRFEARIRYELRKKGRR